MMLDEPITIVVEPARIEIGSAESRAREEQYQLDTYQRLAAELRRYNTAEVNVMRSFLRDIPLRGILLLDPSADFGTTLAECAPERQQDLPPRIILIGADRSDMLQVLEQYRLAGAIETHRFFLWLHQPQSDSGYGLSGLYSIAQAMQADQIGSGPFRSEHYCIFGSSRYSGLVELLGSYLELYVKEHIRKNTGWSKLLVKALELLRWLYKSYSAKERRRT
jgi:hypothetical protein